MTTLFDTGDALRGYRITITARRLSNPVVVNQVGPPQRPPYRRPATTFIA